MENIITELQFAMSDIQNVIARSENANERQNVTACDESTKFSSSL
jgi:hypothetical protein